MNLDYNSITGMGFGFNFTRMTSVLFFFVFNSFLALLNAKVILAEVPGAASEFPSDSALL